MIHFMVRTGEKKLFTNEPKNWMRAGRRKAR